MLLRYGRKAVKLISAPIAYGLFADDILEVRQWLSLLTTN